MVSATAFFFNEPLRSIYFSEHLFDMGLIFKMTFIEYSYIIILTPGCKNNIFSIIHLPDKVLCHIEGEKSVYV